MFEKIKIHLITPEASVARTGNRCTAQQWADLLAEIGCEVTICGPDDAIDAALLVALHGERSHHTIARFRKTQPNGKIIVAMTGTDIYPEPPPAVLSSMKIADRIVVLQSKALEKIPSEFLEKSRVIVQSARIRAERSALDAERFNICVIGHCRDVKDPLRAAAAARLLPESSTIRIRHAGGILDEKYHEIIAHEAAENPRYEWLGELGEVAVAELIADSRLMVLSSRAEGGARVIGEAIVHGVPVISTKIDAALGLLGEGYPAFFPVGDTSALADLMIRAENDAAFYEQLKAITAELAPPFHPDRETAAWRNLIADLGNYCEFS